MIHFIHAHSTKPPIQNNAQTLYTTACNGLQPSIHACTLVNHHQAHKNKLDNPSSYNNSRPLSSRTFLPPFTTRFRLHFRLRLALLPHLLLSLLIIRLSFGLGMIHHSLLLTALQSQLLTTHLLQRVSSSPSVTASTGIGINIGTVHLNKRLGALNNRGLTTRDNFHNRLRAPNNRRLTTVLTNRDLALTLPFFTLREQLTALHPHLRELALDLRVARLPLLDLGELVLQLLELAPGVHLFHLGADALQLPAVVAVALAEDQVVGVVLLEGGAGGDGDKGWEEKVSAGDGFNRNVGYDGLTDPPILARLVQEPLDIARDGAGTLVDERVLGLVVQQPGDR